MCVRATGGGDAAPALYDVESKREIGIVAKTVLLSNATTAPRQSFIYDLEKLKVSACDVRVTKIARSPTTETLRGEIKSGKILRKLAIINRSANAHTHSIVFRVI